MFSRLSDLFFNPNPNPYMTNYQVLVRFRYGSYGTATQHIRTVKFQLTIEIHKTVDETEY